jgi:hypothetical protein
MNICRETSCRDVIKVKELPSLHIDVLGNCVIIGMDHQIQFRILHHAFVHEAKNVKHTVISCS